MSPSPTLIIDRQSPVGPTAVIIMGLTLALGAFALAVATRRLRPPIVTTAPATPARPEAEILAA